MGLHLNYRLTLPGDTAGDDVRRRLASLLAFAKTVGFEKVLGPSEYTTDELATLDHRDIIKINSAVLCGDAPDFYGVPFGGVCAFAFVILPGRECEPAAFGFLAPGSRESLGDDDDLHPGEWFWSASCKTQYASMISNDHLLKCHHGLVRVLEHASALGIGVDVHDETGYWEHRSPERLFEAVSGMNRLIARFAGALTDRLGNDHSIEAPIFDHPDFEHLEMEDIELPGQADGSDPEATG